MLKSTLLAYEALDRIVVHLNKLSMEQSEIVLEAFSLLGKENPVLPKFFSGDFLSEHELIEIIEGYLPNNWKCQLLDKYVLRHFVNGECVFIVNMGNLDQTVPFHDALLNAYIPFREAFKSFQKFKSIKEEIRVRKEALKLSFQNV